MEILDWKIMSSGLHKEIDNGIILYGASGTGERLVMLLKDIGLDSKILAVVDSDKKKWGREYAGGYKILCPEVINSYSHNTLIVITSTYVNEIFQYLHNELKCSQNICSSFSLRHALHCSIMNNDFNCLNKKIREKYEKKYDLWKSIEIEKHYNEQQYYFIKMMKCILENNISILLCGMPKTGNISLIKSFKAYNKKDITFTFHLTYYDKNSLKILKDTLNYYNNNQIKIISGIRSPIERIISKKWESIRYKYLYNNISLSTFLDENYENFIDNLIEYEKNFLNKYNYSDYPYSDAYNWFNDHIKKTFDIDVFDYPFDKDKGYSIIKKDNISIFIYRLDKLSGLEEELREFSGKSDFKLKSANIASEKRYAFAYRQYLEEVKVKKEFFNTLVNSKGMTHFYTKRECEEYMDKWKNKLI